MPDVNRILPKVTNLLRYTVFAIVVVMVNIGLKNIDEQINGAIFSNNSNAIKTGVQKKPLKLFDGPPLPERFQLKDSDNSFYFTPQDTGIGCYTIGTVHPKPGMKRPCKCRKGFYGPNCSIPEVVMTSICIQDPKSCASLKARSKPRRIIHFFNVHHEFDHVEIQLAEHSDLVDVFVMAESNRTTSGEPNELVFLSKMKNQGLYKEFQSRIVHIIIPSTDFPKDDSGSGGGWITDAFIRNYLGEKGLARIDGIRDDDLIFLTDTDEFVSKDILLFLMLHDGFPEPVKVNFVESEYGFYWRRALSNTAGEYIDFDWVKLPIACTVAMLRQVYDNKIMRMRRPWIHPMGRVEGDVEMRKDIADRKVIYYAKNGMHNISNDLAIGRLEATVAGFHCTWCFNPEGIRTKWMAANKQELADWGPNKEKLNLDYIKEGVAKGNLFGLAERNLYLVKPFFEGDLNFAPDYVWKNKDKFAFLLYPNSTEST